MQLTNGAIPLLKQIARMVRPIQAKTTVAEVVELFQRDNAVLELPLEDGESPVGAISRRELFFKHLAKPFAQDLYCRKPISMLMDCKPLRMPAEWNAHQGLDELLRRDPLLTRDSFGLLEAGRCCAVVPVSDLMMAISRLQSGLLDALEQMSRRIRDEVEMARRIQAKLLPAAPVRHGSLTVAGGVVNSSEISGDFFDIFTLDAARIGMLVGDVTGHGVQSGLVTTAAKAGLHLLLERGSRTPADLLSGINRAVLAVAGDTLLMTAVVAIIDLAEHTAVFASAGHPYPYLFSADRAVWQQIPLDAGLPLGFCSDSEYRDLALPFCPGDRLLLYSDGIIEAERADGVSFGEGAFATWLDNSGSHPPDQLRDALFRAVLDFTGRNLCEDDNTVVFAVYDEENR